MIIAGCWHLCDDGIVRPIILGEILAAGGSWVKAPFLVDTGADRTVFAADVFQSLHLQPINSPDRLSSAGGAIQSVVLATDIRFTHDQGAKVIFKGQFAACNDLDALDMSVLGRDIINLFSLIIDRQGDRVCLVGQQHYYSIHLR